MVDIDKLKFDEKGLIPAIVVDGTSGDVLTLATGRLSRSARPAAELFPGDVPLILCNGALIQSSATGAILHEDVMDSAAAEASPEGAGRLKNISAAASTSSAAIQARRLLFPVI